MDLATPPTQDTIQQRRRLAQALMQQGTDTAPVGHWTQAAARAAQALIGSYHGNQANTAATQREAFDTKQAEAKQGANRAYAEGAMEREVQQKMKLAEQAGLQQGSPEFKQYVYGIKPMEAAGSDMPANVREYEYVSKLPPEQRQQYLAIKRAQQTFDLGTSYGIADPMNPGQLQGQVQKDVAGAEQQKVIGRETGERQAAAPKAQTAMKMMDAKSDVVIRTVEEAEKMVGSLTSGFAGSALSMIPGTAARDLSAKIDTLKANAGFQELQDMRDNSPTGGALGQVAVQELAMLQATITSLEQAQSPQQLKQALNTYKTFVRESKVRRKLAYEMTYGGGGQMPAVDVQQGGDGWEEIDGVRIRAKR